MLSDKFRISEEAQVELVKRGTSSSMGHGVLALVVCLFTNLSTDLPQDFYTLIGLIFGLSFARWAVGFHSTPVFLSLLVALSLSWSRLCHLTLMHYGLHHSSTIILLLVTCGIAAAALTSLVPSFFAAAIFLTCLLALPTIGTISLNEENPLPYILITYYFFLLFQARTHTEQFRQRVKIEEVLRLRNQELQVATNVKAEFLANVSHEIRTPINGILGMANLLSKENLTPNGKNYLKIMTTCGDTLLTLINDILDFSKMEAGKLTIEDVDFHFNGLLGEVVSLFAPRAKDKGIELQVNSTVPENFWARADSTRLRQILFNLVGNAIKFTPKGEVVISAGFQPLHEDMYILEMSVRDSGVGIPPEIKSKLFQSFTQADASTTRKFGGTGLGLAICKGLCETMGGSIWVESEVGAGAKFFFKILVKHGQKVEMESSGAFFDLQLATKLPFTILVADDNSTNQMLARQYLEMLGYRVDTVGNGLEVLDAVGTKTYDVIFMDGQMPEMDGYEATRKIHKRFSEEKLPWIVALTASATDKDRQHCIESGMNDFVAKPFTIDSLISALKRVKNKEAQLATPVISTPTSSNDSEIKLNKELLYQHFGTDTDIMLRFIESYLVNFPKMFWSLKTAVDFQNEKALKMAAHSLRGSVSNFFAVSICDQLAELENNHELSWEDITEKINKLEKDLNSLNEQINEITKIGQAA